MTVAALFLAFIFGVAAAAPVGPVNMVAIRRGLISGWVHTLFVGAGSVAVEICFIALGLWGGSRVHEAIPRHLLERVLGLPAAGFVAIVGLLILYKARRRRHRVLAAEEMAQRASPTGIVRDVATGAALTAINPATIVYWILGAGPTWLTRADLPPGSPVILLGVLSAGGGLACWFAFIAMLVRLRPQRVGPRFFQWVNVLCGLGLLGTGAALAIHGLVK